MEHAKSDESNPWKLATFALAGIIAIMLIAGLMIANHEKTVTVMDDVAPAVAPAYDAPPVPRGAVPARRAPAKPPPVPRAQAPLPEK